MPTKISNIKMAGFRGATLPVEIEFDPNKSVTLIFGENGTGKSTIADAFDFVCNQSYGSLDSYSLGGPSRKYVASVNCELIDVEVSLSCGSSTWTALFSKEGPVVTPQNDCPDARILRRKSILKLIEAQPKPRFEELKAFIAVPGIDKSEKALRDAVTETDREYDEATRALAQAEQELEKLWSTEGRPGKTASDWANKEAGKDVAQLISKVSEISKIVTAFQDSETALKLLDNAISNQTIAKEYFVAAETTQAEAENKLATQSSMLIKLLNEAKTYITEKTPINQCPVCEQNIVSEDLVKRLDVRISEMQELSYLVAKMEQAKNVLAAKKLLVTEARKTFCQKAQLLMNSLKSSTFSEVTKLALNWEDFGLLFGFIDPSEDVEQQGRQLYDTAVLCRQSLTKTAENEQKSINQYNAIKGHADTLKQKTVEARNLEMLLSQLKVALELVFEQRRSYVEGILEDVSGEAEELFGKLHPGEGIGKIRFWMKQKAIGSLEFDAQFQNMAAVPPQAYYSESHLDTLGICVFLALAKHFKNDKTIIILDDVLTSVDSQHLDRFMTLLQSLSAEFNQLIVTTHYRPWRDRYRWAKGPTANTQVIELGPWTLKGGLQTGEFVTAVSELQKSLQGEQFDCQTVSSKAGIVLESLLDFITLKYRCKIPRNANNEYSLGDLATGIDSKLGKELRSRKPSSASGTKTDTPLKPLIEACTADQWIRNTVGCHFSTLGMEITDEDVRQFSKNVLRLASELICDKCGTLPTRRPSGSNWQCQCGEIELYPLVYPGADPGTVDDEG